ISGRLATKSNQIKQLIRNGRSASLQRTFKKSFTSFSHSTRNKTRDGLIRVRNIRALNGRFNTSITHAYSIVIGSKHITLNAKLVLTSVTPASSAPVLQTPKATSSTLYFDSLTVNAGNGGFLHCIQMDTSVNAA